METVVSPQYRNDKVLIDNIIECVSRAYNLSPDDLRARKQTQEVVEARHIAVYLISVNTKQTLQSIGVVLGNFSPATIHHGFMKIAEALTTDKDIRTKVSDIVAEVNHVAS